MPQTSVADRMTVGIVGQIATLSGMADAEVDTAYNEEASAGIVVGRFVKRGTDKDNGALKCSSAADVLKGIACFGHDFARNVELDTNLDFAPKTHFGCLVEGPITVAPTTAAAPGDEVHVQVVAEAGHAVGDVRKTASAGKTLDISALAQWKTTAASAADPCILWIDMANIALATAD